MKITAFATDRTVALRRFDLGGRFGREFHAAAMTAADMSNQQQLPKCKVVYAVSSIFLV
jgi:hypothetical protein